jgi:hypothetical protein
MKKVFVWAGYVSLLAVCIFVTFHTSLQFGFWKDDWMSVWKGIYIPGTLLRDWIHPAGNFELIFFSRVFGDNVYLWQSVGLLLRLIAALAVTRFSTTLFKSKNAGVISGILFATTVIGMDATVWMSAYVNLFAIIFLCIGFHFWISYLRKPHNISLLFAVTSFCIAFISDVWRMFWIVPLMQYFVWITTKGDRRDKRIKIFYIIYILGFCVLPICLLISWPIIVDSQIVQYISRHANEPLLIISKLPNIGNMFNSLFYMCVGWIVPLYENGTLGIHNRYEAYAGLLFVLVSAFLIIRAKLSRNTKQLFGFFFLWILGFYLMNWVFQPRLTVGVSHRYQTISGIGLLLFISWVLMNIKSKYLSYSILVIIIFCNMLRATQLLNEQLRYRSDTVIQNSWGIVEKEIPLDNGPVLLYFSGNSDLFYNVFALSGSAPLALQRKYSQIRQFPLVAYDAKSAANFVCNGQSQFISTDRVYAWEVQEHTLIPIHEKVRHDIASLCVIQ